MGTITEIRRSPFNPSFRIVEPHELVAGLEIYIVDVRSQYEPNHPFSKITLDEDPIREKVAGRPMVYYHCTFAPSWEGQCFVPIQYMTSFAKDRTDNVGPYDHEYWLPVVPER